MEDFYKETIAEMEKQGLSDSEIERRLDSMVNIANLVILATGGAR
jgi:hypothetical protein